MIGALGGPAACSFVTAAKGKQPFALKYVVAVKDENKFNQVIEEACAMISTDALGDFYKSLGTEISFSMKRGVDHYKGVSIDSAKLVMKSTDPNSPQGQMMSAMYGEGFDGRWGMVDGLWVSAVGDDADSAVRELIDEVRAGGPREMSAEVKAALALIPQASKADFVGTYNFLRVSGMFGAMMPVPMPRLDVPTKSNIAFAGKVGDGKMAIEIALPKQHLTEIMSAIQKLREQKMQMPAARVITTKANLRMLHSAVIQFKLDTGRFPSEEEGLTVLVEQPTDVENWEPGGYLKTRTIPKDGWGHDFVYDLYPDSGKPFVIKSLGADGKEGGTGCDADLLSTDRYEPTEPPRIQQPTSIRSKGSGLDSIKHSLMTWVKCKRPECGATYQMDKKAYYVQLREKVRATPRTLQTPALVCKKCTHESIFRAVKCEKCGLIFFYGRVGDFDDRCPECKYSKMEELRKKALQGRYNKR
jgi:general secretion pathway protein G